MRWVVGILVALAVSGSGSAQGPGTPLTVNETQLGSAISASGAPGIAVAVVRADRVVYARGFGVASTETRLQRAMSTIFIVVDRERLVARMRARAMDHEDEIARRMATAEAELREAAKFDFVIESHTREDDFARLLEIVEKARARVTEPPR